MRYFTRADRRPSLKQHQLVNGMLYEIADIGTVQFLNRNEKVVNFLSLEGKGKLRMSIDEVDVRDIRRVP